MNETDPAIETLNWGSHLPALMACVAVGDGPVLEIGCGHFSTPCLHAICSALGHPLVTLEMDDGWRSKFDDYESAGHRVLKQTDEVVRKFAEQKWGVVLIDDQADNRLEWVGVFFNSARYVLFHDCNFPQYGEALNKWLAENPCNSSIYTRYGPHTLVISKEHQIPVLQP
jgi:hypothetical protein